MKRFEPKVTETLDNSECPVSNKAVKDSMTKIFNGTYTTGSLAGNNDYTITIPLPTGWTKITGISAIIYPKSSWNTVGYLLVPTYQSDGTATFGIHTIGTTAQAYAVAYTALGN